MEFSSRLKHIGAELKGHVPFTTFGAVVGVAMMLVFRDVGESTSRTMFSIFHPGHVLLSAMVTASMFKMHYKGRKFLLILVIGYVGSIGVATLSDSVVPYIGESILGLDVPTHGHIETDEYEEGEHLLHLGFIEDWWIVNPAAILGVLIAFYLPRTKFPHAGHVLLSTWASSAHILMNTHIEITIGILGGIFVLLFIAVWLPCCVSDIIFPLLFVRGDLELVDVCACANHVHHSHEHIHEHSEECPEGHQTDENI